MTTDVVFKVYKAAIILGKEIKFIDPHIIEIEPEIFYKFKWDRINRLDIMSSNSIVLLSESEEALNSYLLGFYHATRIDKDFSDEVKEKFKKEKLIYTSEDNNINVYKNEDL